MLKYNSWQLNRILFSRRLDSEAHMYNKAALAADFNGKLASFIHTHVHMFHMCLYRIMMLLSAMLRISLSLYIYIIYISCIQGNFNHMRHK